ncbi:hypothetical protein SK128_028565 [Halocaridina rubra]|uniref:Uncharacterized protein n=1 Tax=Halocaridina rubra TaxID=373956 RepID=A0AAN9AFJ9_HALRR
MMTNANMHSTIHLTTTDEVQMILEIYCRLCSNRPGKTTPKITWQVLGDSEIHEEVQDTEYMSRVPRAPARADKKGAQRFMDSADDIIKGKGYLAEQIFKADDMGLFWKWTLACTYIYKED